jgi:hypothetical protein
MAERPHHLGESELERALVDLGSRVDYPPTPDLARRVRERVAAQPARPWPLWATLLPVQRRLAFALLAVVALAGGILAFSPEARTVVAERLGLRGVRIEHVPFVPTATPGPVGDQLSLGERVTLDEARARVPYPVLMPALPELGEPDEVYLGAVPPGGQVALIYWARPGLPAASETGVGLLLMQFRAAPGAADRGVLGKGVGPETRIEALSVNGGPAVWIEGNPHFLFYRDTTGQLQQEAVRLAGNVLLWEQSGLTLRVEGAFPKDQALRIAASVK